MANLIKERTSSYYFLFYFCLWFIVFPQEKRSSIAFQPLGMDCKITTILNLLHIDKHLFIFFEIQTENL